MAWYRNKCDWYGYIIKSLLFGASITTDSKTISTTCNWLNGSEATYTHDDEYNTLGVENLDKITSQTLVRNPPIGW